jgi:hypothetical protein
MCFKASDFTLPEPGSHHISYDAFGAAWRFSDDPEQVERVKPLVSEIEQTALEALKLAYMIKKLRIQLDEVAKDIGLPPRPERLEDQELVNMFGYTKKRSSEDTPGMSFLASSDDDQKITEKLANGIRKMLKGSIRDAPMTFLEDLYASDLRCRQITGQPLIIGVENNLTDETNGA